MAAARVSKTIVSIEVDVPSKDSGELVQALAKQIVAYSLRNMEIGPWAEVVGKPDTTSQSTEKIIEVPDILMHLVGHVDGSPENHDQDAPAPDEDYIVSGNAVVKALSIFLGNNAADIRRGSRERLRLEEDASTIADQPTAKTARLKTMSMNMLDSARKIRNRLQPALYRECVQGDEQSLSRWNLQRPHYNLIILFLERLQFLDQTIKRIIEQFEAEYPECRQRSTSEAKRDGSESSSEAEAPSPVLSRETSKTIAFDDEDDNENDEDNMFKGRISRRGSDMSLVSRNQAEEEGRVHRLGQQMRREVFDRAANQISSDSEFQDERMEALKAKFDGYSGEELKARLKEFEGRSDAELVEGLLKDGALHG